MKHLIAELPVFESVNLPVLVTHAADRFVAVPAPALILWKFALLLSTRRIDAIPLTLLLPLAHNIHMDVLFGASRTFDAPPPMVKNEK